MRITLSAPYVGGAGPKPTTGVLVNDRLEVAARFAVGPGMSTTLDVAPGIYTARFRRGAGANTALRVDTDAVNTLLLRPSRSIRKQLGGAPAKRTGPPMDREAAGEAAVPRMSNRALSGSREPLAARIRRMDFGADGLNFNHRGELLEINAGRSLGALSSLHVRRPVSPSCRRPEQIRCECARQHAELRMPTYNSAVLLRTLCPNMLEVGALNELRSKLHGPDAEQLLQRKVADPAAAAVGGYCLLRTADRERLHDWPGNLADLYPEMPDGAIIHAWQLILADSLNTPALVTERLLAASRAGPRFSPRASDSFVTVWTCWPLMAPKFPRRQERHARVGCCIGPRPPPFTTFAGISPQEPTLSPHAPSIPGKPLSELTG